MDGPVSPQATRPSLLIRIRDPRDGEAWETFVDTYLPMIYRYARRMGLQDADSADVSQEVLVEVARLHPGVRIPAGPGAIPRLAGGSGPKAGGAVPEEEGPRSRRAGRGG